MTQHCLVTVLHRHIGNRPGIRTSAHDGVAYGNGAANISHTQRANYLPPFSLGHYVRFLTLNILLRGVFFVFLIDYDCCAYAAAVLMNMFTYLLPPLGIAHCCPTYSPSQCTRLLSHYRTRYHRPLAGRPCRP